MVLIVSRDFTSNKQKVGESGSDKYSLPPSSHPFLKWAFCYMFILFQPVLIKDNEYLSN